MSKLAYNEGVLAGALRNEGDYFESLKITRDRALSVPDRSQSRGETGQQQLITTDVCLGRVFSSSLDSSSMGAKSMFLQTRFVIFNTCWPFHVES